MRRISLALLVTLGCTGNGAPSRVGSPCRSDEDCEQHLMCDSQTCHEYTFSRSKGFHILGELETLEGEHGRMVRRKAQLESDLEHTTAEAEREVLREKLHGVELWLETSNKKMDRARARR